jgi:predicted phosphodiesterase
MTRRGLLLVLVVAAVVGFAVAAAARWAGDNDSSDPASRQSTDSPVSDSRSARVWAVGDGADGGNASMQVAELIEKGRPDRVLYLGDVYEEGSADEFERNYRPAYSRFDEITFPTPGNHDWQNHDAGYDPYWEKANPQVPTNRHYYRFTAGGWEFISLNSESGLEAGSPQRKWLKAQLRGKRGNCRIAFWHRPFLNAGRHGDQKDTGVLWRALKGRATIVLNGHDHNLQHFKPRDGIVELVSGAGGHQHYSSNQNDPRLAWDEDDQFGALRLDLRPGLARFRFVAVDKGTIHSGRVRCRRS